MTGGARAGQLDELRILIVEDEFFIADDLRSALADGGAEVLGPVPTCAEAIAVIEREPAIAFAMLDINLGGELSFPVADLLIERGVPFVFATGYEQRVVPERYGSVTHWEKPFDLSAIAAALPALIATPPGRRLTRRPMPQQPSG